ncbi:MAG TPA: diguanylate cyclase [Terriglobia bacterium]|nr:diguanylate cyclase [Terriglobia bacterium]
MKVLIAEDDSISRRMLEAFLVKWGYEVLVATEGEEAWGILQANDAPRLAVLDWMMPGRDGIDICRSVRQRKGRPYVYILLLTARGQKQDIVEGLEAGADDYVTKPFDPYELRARLRAGRRIVELQEQLLQAREALRDQASRDPLTDLWNHGTILAILRKEIARASRTHTPFAIAMADVDRFKAINDTYGHPAGDAVLREAARRLRGAMRTYDSLGRYGGDEFLAVVPGCDPAAAARFAESFRARIDRKAIETPEGLITVTLSLGVVALEDLREVKSETLIRVADAALYRAKIAGRNRVALATHQDIEREVSKHIQECEPLDPDILLTDLPTPQPPI